MRASTFSTTAARAALLLLLCLAAAEATVRVVATFVPTVRLLAQPSGAREPDPADFAGFQRTFSEHLVPFLELNGFRCNSLGFHDLEFARDFPPDGFRIVALGDSFTFGVVPYRDTEMTLAETLLAAAPEPGRQVAAPVLEIDNLGVSATGVSDHRLVYDFVGRPLKPDLVLVQLYLGNDPRDFAGASAVAAERTSGRRSWLLTFLRRATRLVRERWRGATLDPALDRSVFSDATFAWIMRDELHVLAKPGTDPGAPDWDGFDVALERLLDDIAADGTPAVLVLAPSRLQVHADELRAVAARAGIALDTVDPDLPNRRVRALAARRRIPVIDTTEALRRAAASGDALYLPNDPHWNRRGNAVAAAELATSLVRQGLVPGGVPR